MERGNYCGEDRASSQQGDNSMRMSPRLKMDQTAVTRTAVMMGTAVARGTAVVGGRGLSSSSTTNWGRAIKERNRA